MKKIAIGIGLLMLVSVKAQTTLIFDYDAAGNQIYRGPNTTSSKTSEETAFSLQEEILSEEDKFWLNMRIYPVPVKDILTIDWNEDNDSLIKHITLYQHSTLANVYQKQKMPNDNRHLEINMSGFYPGVYILSFELYDGNVISKNIVKE